MKVDPFSLIASVRWESLNVPLTVESTVKIVLHRVVVLVLGLLVCVGRGVW